MTRKLFLGLFWVFATIYFLLQLILGSTPVQKRIVAEVKKALNEYGVEIQIESVEFSTFSPRIFLNRVTLIPLNKKTLPFLVPLKIDKIKIEFEPLALITKEISFKDISLFHPSFQIKNGNLIINAVQSSLKKSKPIQAKSLDFRINIKKVKILDALFDIEFPEQKAGVYSRSFTVELTDVLSLKKEGEFRGKDVAIQYGDKKIFFEDFDFKGMVKREDFSVERLGLKNKDLSINASLSIEAYDSPAPIVRNLTYDLKLPLSYLELLPFSDLPKFEGIVDSRGSYQVRNNVRSANGEFKYQGLTVDGYGVGQGALSYTLENDKIFFQKMVLQYSGGTLRNPRPVSIVLKDDFPLDGTFLFEGVQLEKILENVKATEIPVRMGLGGKVDFTGRLAKSFEIKTKFSSQTSPITVFSPSDSEAGETILETTPGTMDADINFFLDKMTFDGKIQTLLGQFKTYGALIFKKSDAELVVEGKQVSFTALKRISSVDFGGVANLKANINYRNDEVEILGSFDAKQFEVSDVQLGDVEGQCFYNNGLLSFENLVVANEMDALRGDGFVDFNSEKTHYRFQAATKRAPTNQVFYALSKMKIPFKAPKDGEMSARFSIEGGHREGVPYEIRVNGEARNFKWYDEDWFQSQYALNILPKKTKVTKLTLLKKMGAIEVKGDFGKEDLDFQVAFSNIRLEEMNHLSALPVKGVFSGSLVWVEEKNSLETQGNGKFSQLFFRGKRVPNLISTIHRNKSQIEVSLNSEEQALKADWSIDTNTRDWKVNLKSQKVNAWPFLSYLSQKDFPQIEAIPTSVEMRLKGNSDRFSTWVGKGIFTQLYIELQDQSLKNSDSISFEILNNHLSVPNFEFLSKSSVLKGNVFYDPQAEIRADVQANMDFQFLQPFVPIFDAGQGDVVFNVKFQGPPQKFSVLGNLRMENGVLRIKGLRDEIREVTAQLSINPETINFDLCRGKVGEGMVTLNGQILWSRFKDLSFDLKLLADEVTLHTGSNLTSILTGDFQLQGNKSPYRLTGNCRLLESSLTSFQVEPKKETGKPALSFDISCEGKNRLFVLTDVMNAEFKGRFNILGTDERVALLGEAESLQGFIVFKDRKFKISTAIARFESKEKIVPRFNVIAQANISETAQSSTDLRPPQSYDVTLQARGIPSQYKISLTSIPELKEPEIISLLLLGVPTQRQEGNYLDFGSAIVGQIPIQSKIENQLGLDIRLGTQTSSKATTSTATSSSTGSTGTTAGNSSANTTDTTVPNVQIQKEITKKTKLSYSNSIETTPLRELKIEHMLDDNLSVNGTASEKSKAGFENQTTQSYGIDFRYRFQFE